MKWIGILNAFCSEERASSLSTRLVRQREGKWGSTRVKPITFLPLLSLQVSSHWNLDVRALNYKTISKIKWQSGYWILHYVQRIYIWSIFHLTVVSNKESEQYQMYVSHTMTEWQPLKLDNHFKQRSFFFIYFLLFYILSFTSFHKG